MIQATLLAIAVVNCSCCSIHPNYSSELLSSHSKITTPILLPAPESAASSTLEIFSLLEMENSWFQGQVGGGNSMDCDGFRYVPMINPNFVMAMVRVPPADTSNFWICSPDWSMKSWNDQIITSSTARRGGGSFKNRKRIGEIGCCESRMTKQEDWQTVQLSSWLID